MDIIIIRHTYKVYNKYKAISNRITLKRVTLHLVRVAIYVFGNQQLETIFG